MLRVILYASLTVVIAIPVFAVTRTDQVLVLYNSDWTQDLDGSEPGQDPEKVARYYVQQRTDPVSGRKPYILGLSLKQGKQRPLNQKVMQTKEGDNYYGLIFNGRGTVPEKDWPRPLQVGETVEPIAGSAAGCARPHKVGRGPR